MFLEKRQAFRPHAFLENPEDYAHLAMNPAANWPEKSSSVAASVASEPGQPTQQPIGDTEGDNRNKGSEVWAARRPDERREASEIGAFDGSDELAKYAHVIFPRLRVEIRYTSGRSSVLN